jgi:hypothetical protein
MNIPSLVTVGATCGAALALVLSIGVAQDISQAAKSNFPDGYYAKAGVALAENQADKDAAKAAEHQNASHPQDPPVPTRWSAYPSRKAISRFTSR